MRNFFVCMIVLLFVFIFKFILPSNIEQANNFKLRVILQRQIEIVSAMGASLTEIG